MYSYRLQLQLAVLASNALTAFVVVVGQADCLFMFSTKSSDVNKDLTLKAKDQDKDTQEQGQGLGQL